MIEYREDEIVAEEHRSAVAECESEFRASNCFGWDEAKTDRWLIKCADVWYFLASFIWFLFGALTFAPVIFMSNKVNVIFKNKKRSLICGILIYVMAIATIVSVVILSNIS